jgi:hypothetical protein
MNQCEAELITCIVIVIVVIVIIILTIIECNKKW